MTALIMQLSRPHLVQDYVEQFMEMAVAFGINQLLLVDPGNHAAGVRNIRPSQLEYLRTDSLQQALSIADGVPVYLSETAPQALAEFQHPAQAVYVLGDDIGTMTLPPGADALRIEIKTTGHLWSQQAAAIVLHDRLIKSL